MKLLSLLLLFAVLLPASAASTAREPGAPGNTGSSARDLVLAEAGRWVCKRTDNVCGLNDARQLSSPAKIDYESALKATSQMKKMRDKGIDPKSPEGIQLRIEAQNAVKRAAQKVAQEKGYCSVWRKISHTDGRRITDITALVKAKF